MMRFTLLISLSLSFLAALSGCGDGCDHPAEQCSGLDGYLTYYNGKLDPTHMCGVLVSGGGLHFHWDLPAGTCACDVHDDGNPEAATWTGCRYTASDGNSSDPSGPSSSTSSTGGSTGKSSSGSTGTGGGA